MDTTPRKNILPGNYIRISLTGIRRNTSYSLNSNPASPLIITLETVEGEQLQVLGDKDEDGVATGVESLVYDDRIGNTTFITLNPNNSLPDTVTTLSGAYLHFDWGENLTEVIVTAVSPNGSLQVTVNIDLSDINTTDTTNRSKRDTNTEQSDVDLSDIDFSDSDANVQKRSSSHPKKVLKTSLTKRQSGSTAKVPVTVTHCNEPEPNAKVFANALLDYRNTPSGPRWTGVVNYMAVHTSAPGVYHIQIPTQQSSTLGETISKVCGKIVSIVGHGCTIASGINPALELRICIGIALAGEVATFAIPGDYAAIFVVCEATFRAFRFYCDTLGASAGPGAPSIADAICSSITVTDDAIGG